MGTSVIGLDHVYFSVTDLARSEAFYDQVMPVLGFKKSSRPIDGDPHIHYYGRHFGLSLRPARNLAGRHDAYAPGLHHFCFRVETVEDVEAVHLAITSRGIEASTPKLYPEYAPDYYATFFTDPDGIRLEVTNYRQQRKRHFVEFAQEESRA